jgi:hypothetical protein
MLKSPARAVVAVCFIALLAWTLESLLHTGYFTLLAVLLVWSQVAGFFLPTVFTLTEDGVRVKGLVSKKEKRWEEFRSYYVDREGVLLSPFLDRSRLERFRGVSLQFHGNRDQVVAFVSDMMTREREADANVGHEGQGDRRGEEG